MFARSCGRCGKPKPMFFIARDLANVHALEEKCLIAIIAYIQRNIRYFPKK